MTELSQRLDRWLWFARFFKSRALATRFCASSKLRINGVIAGKAHHVVRIGDVLTFPKERDIRVIKILGLGTRRGPAPEARALYDDLEPPPVRGARRTGETRPMQTPHREPGTGRPTKAERRATDRLKENS